MGFVHDVELQKAIMDYLYEQLSKSKGNYYKLRDIEIVAHIKKVYRVSPKRILNAIEDLEDAGHIILLYERFKVYIPTDKKDKAASLHKLSPIQFFLLICVYGYLAVVVLLYSAYRLSNPITLTTWFGAALFVVVLGLFLPLVFGIAIYGSSMWLKGTLEKLNKPKLSTNSQLFLVSFIISSAGSLLVFAVSSGLGADVKTAGQNALSIGVTLFITLFFTLRFGRAKT
ncbi:MAG TPA: hypothetical protein VMV00_03170 [Candidatus Baltobacteraceae bacterium]|nr:hypothetical protein [Candidatus Baltobacteraceae bacterium]